MLEQLDWNITQDSVAVALNHLVNLGCVDYKDVIRHWAPKEQRTLPRERLRLYRWKEDVPRDLKTRLLALKSRSAALHTVEQFDRYETA